MIIEVIVEIRGLEYFPIAISMWIGIDLQTIHYIQVIVRLFVGSVSATQYAQHLSQIHVQDHFDRLK
jgi:hypothetical protein